ncbi:MAG: DEAD/DEAH box helicase [Verrucomicrobia bacterium]|nr:DEAD/DEAH box helicase [Verrucomicrobiota bacterium]
MAHGTPVFRDWFTRCLGTPTPAQAAAWPRIRSGHAVLVLSPPGTGKTLAAFLEVLESLAAEHSEGRLAETIHAIYVSPLRALGYDLHRNLRRPLEGVYGSEPPIRVALRSGDTPPAERERQRTRPPHVLLTTPESLALLLSQSRWVPHLERVRWVIVDEIHALAENKRGAHLALSLERLDALQRAADGTAPAPGRVVRRTQRIGLSATVFPADAVAAFLSGGGPPCEVVQATELRKLDLRVYSPLRQNPYPPAGYTGVRLFRELSRLVSAHQTTLVFTNTRSGAEMAAHGLKEQLPKLAGQIECHHASLDRDLRLEVEDRLKRGELRAVICSTSLELGIDIGSIDLVVMLSTPKGVSRTVQRTGRAGHQVHSISRGLLMATNVGDLVECAAMARLGRRGEFDRVRIPEAPLDVLAQHLMGLACLGPVPEDAAFALIRGAAPYRALPRAEFDEVLDYLAGGGRALRQQYTETFGKILRDADAGTFEARDGPPRRDFLQNVGTIPSEGVVRVVLHTQTLGTVEESFLGRLRPGDVFSLGGRALRLDRVGTLEAWVSRADGVTPTVPRWGANKMPLSNRVGLEIAAFRTELRARLEAIPFRESPSLIPWIADRLECGAENATVIFRTHAAQHQLSEIPGPDAVLIEEFVEPVAPPEPEPVPNRRTRPAGRQRVLTQPSLFPLPATPAPKTAGGSPTAAGSQRHLVFVHTLIGRAANDALSRVVAWRLARRGLGNAIASPDDYGFALTLASPITGSAITWPELLDPSEFVEQLEASLANSDLLKYHFRNAAQTGLMVYRQHFGNQKPLRKLQWSAEVIFNVLSRHEPGHVLLREARRDALHNFLDAPSAVEFLQGHRDRGSPVRTRRLTRIPPLSFGMYASRLRETLLLEDPRETLERLYHQWWTAVEGLVPGSGAPQDGSGGQR